MNVVFFDKYISIRPYSSDVKIVELFGLKSWFKIEDEFSSDEEWSLFLNTYPNFVDCFIFYENSTGEPFSFIFVLHEYDDIKKVSVHGGGWKNGMHYTKLNYRALFLFAETLFAMGFKIRTSCLINNNNAFRFLKGAGFVRYRKNERLSEMYLLEKRMRNSKIYARIM